MTHEEVYPEVKNVRSTEARASSEPFRAERHPAVSDELVNSKLSVRRGTASDPPSIDLGCRKDDNPVVTSRIVLDKLIEDVAAEGTSAEDGEKLEGDYGGVGVSPASVGFGVFFPCKQS